MEELKREIPTLEAQIKTFSFPPNLQWGVVILVYLAVFGILFPVLIISLEAFYNFAKVLITTTFLIGIIAVLAYIVFQIRTLKK